MNKKSNTQTLSGINTEFPLVKILYTKGKLNAIFFDSGQLD